MVTLGHTTIMPNILPPAQNLIQPHACGSEEMFVKDQSEDELKDATAVYIANLKDSSIPSSSAQKILSLSRELIGSVVCTIEKAAAPLLEDISRNVIPCKDEVETFQSTLNTLKDPIQSFKLSTEYQQTQFAIKADALVKPKEKVLGHVYKEKIDKITGRTEQILSDETFQYVPIEANLKLFLEQPGYMSNITDYKQNASREDYVVKSYLDGLYYKAKNNQVLDKSMTIDLLLYNDEFETANPLGSKKGKHKVLGIYISLICLPRKFQAKLDNILVALAKSSVVSKYGINAILAPLTNELECLYTRGMTINSPGEFVGNIKPKIFLSIGDNLALNTILGFTTSFSANYFCRFCKTRKADTHHQTVEDKTSLRTQNGIGDDIEVNDV